MRPSHQIYLDSFYFPKVENPLHFVMLRNIKLVKKVLQKTTVLIWVSQKELSSNDIDFLFFNGLEILHATTL